MKPIADVLRDAIARRNVAKDPNAQAEYDAFLAAERKQHEAQQRAIWPDHLRQCGAPERVVEAHRKGVIPTAALETAERWLNSDKGFLVLSGHTGCGKTVAACLAFRKAQRLATRLQEPLPEWDSWSGSFVRFTQLRRLSDFDASDRALLQKAANCRALVLDDVGGAPGEEMPPRLRDVFEELVDRRDAAGKRTAITTNLSLQRGGPDNGSDFGRFIGGRILSRLSRGVVAMECGVEDLRRRAP